jgi:hypothetical protein
MPLIRKIYLYLFSLIGLVLVVIACVQLVDLGLKIYFFPAADRSYVYPMAPVAVPAGQVGSSTSANPDAAQLAAYEDQQTTSRHEQTASEALAMILVGAPLYLYHWRTIRREKSEG